MNIVLQAVNQNNWLECTRLDVTDDQRATFPCPVVYWLAESKFVPYFNPMVIYADDQMVGFLVYGLDPDDGEYWLIAMLIDKRYQGRGFARQALVELVKFVREQHDCKRLKLGHRPENFAAEKLYASMGFVQVGTLGNEIVRCLEF